MLFALNVFIFSICFAVGLCVFIFVPLFIYVIPYALWSGTLKGKRTLNNSKGEPFFKSCKNATILYKSWILRKEPRF